MAQEQRRLKQIFESNDGHGNQGWMDVLKALVSMQCHSETKGKRTYMPRWTSAHILRGSRCICHQKYL